MQRAGRLIAKARLGGDCVTPEDLGRAAWPVAVGPRISVHSRAVQLVRDRLVVEVDDAVWQRQLFSLRGQILGRLEQVIGPGIVGELEFRVGIPRIGAQRVERRPPLFEGLPDEADGIASPALRMLYKAARKKATA